MTTEPLRPLLSIIMDALHKRGWQFEGEVYVDPEGNKYGSLEQAITAQTFREIATVRDAIDESADRFEDFYGPGSIPEHSDPRRRPEA